jgi:transcriptional regulator with XRE-family HTH domain
VVQGKVGMIMLAFRWPAVEARVIGMSSSDQGGAGDAETLGGAGTIGGEDVTSGAASELWEKQLAALGGFIRVQRRLADMSLREMAALTSVSNAYLSQIERGLHQPSLRVLRSIAQALSIAPEELLRRANFMSPAGTGSGPGAAGPDAGPPDTEAAIKADPRLTPGQREALLNVYRSFRAAD